MAYRTRKNWPKQNRKERGPEIGYRSWVVLDLQLHWNSKRGSPVYTPVIALFLVRHTCRFIVKKSTLFVVFLHFLVCSWSCRVSSLELRVAITVLFLLAVHCSLASTWKYEMANSLYCSMAGRSIIREGNSIECRVWNGGKSATDV